MTEEHTKKILLVAHASQFNEMDRKIEIMKESYGAKISRTEVLVAFMEIWNSIDDEDLTSDEIYGTDTIKNTIRRAILKQAKF